MGRFRYSGTNWEGRPWAVSAALKQLGIQISEQYPTPHGADGTVASKTHDLNSPRSDHRPYPYSGFGRVRALDWGDPDEQALELIRLSKDSRLRYLIYKSRIFSSYWRNGIPPYTWRPYSGGGHQNHAHISVHAVADANAVPWDIGEGGEIDLKEVYARLQASLIRAGYDLGSYEPYLPDGDPDSLPGADGSWGGKSRAAQDAANGGFVGSPVDEVARADAQNAHTRLDKLHGI